MTKQQHITIPRLSFSAKLSTSTDGLPLPQGLKLVGRGEWRSA